jgi:hypothetical protein
MTDEEFETLKITIEFLTEELTFCQQLYTMQTGQKYVPLTRVSMEDLIKDIIQWNEDPKYYKPLRGETNVSSKTC